MKNIIWALMLFAGCSCAQKAKDTHVYGNLTVTGFSFHQTRAPLFTEAVESSAVEFKGNLIYLIDNGMNGDLSVGNSNDDLVSVNKDARFAYILQDGNTYYNFFNRGGSVYASKSFDLKTWTPINHNQPVLSQTAGTVYQAIWNVGVTIDDTGTFHLMAETSSAGNDTAGLIYATATLVSDELNFNLNRTTNHVIPLAGNPWLGFVPGKGLVAVYGKMVGGLWIVTAAIFENNSWVENFNMVIGAPGIHICDPHVLSYNNELILTVSYDQYSVYELRSTQTLSNLFDQVKGL